MLDIDIKKEIQGRFPLSENRNRRTITSVLFHKRVVTLSKEAFAPIAKTSRRKIHTFPILLKTGVRFFQELFDNWQISNYWDLISCPRTRLQENMICFSPVVETTKDCLALAKDIGPMRHDFMAARSGVTTPGKTFCHHYKHPPHSHCHRHWHHWHTLIKQCTIG